MAPAPRARGAATSSRPTSTCRASSRTGRRRSKRLAGKKKRPVSPTSHQSDGEISHDEDSKSEGDTSAAEGASQDELPEEQEEEEQVEIEQQQQEDVPSGQEQVDDPLEHSVDVNKEDTAEEASASAPTLGVVTPKAKEAVAM